MFIVVIKDLIYFDFNKAASIWSQFEGGLRERITLNEDTSIDQSAGVKLGIPHFAEAKLGTEYEKITSVLETKFLHHDLLNKIEDRLNEQGLVIDLNEKVNTDESSPDTIREVISDTPYIKATGWSFIEDYNRVHFIAENFNKLIASITTSTLENIKLSPQYVELQTELNDKREQIKSISDRNQRAVIRSKIDSIESSIKQMLVSPVPPLANWVVENIKLWIDTFFPTRINLRIFPFESCPSFQIICNLKRDCFVDQDLEHLYFGYGSQPNIPLSVFGLITSLPSKLENQFNPMIEYESQNKLTDKEQFEKGFRTAFLANKTLEDLIRFSRYPNATVHPIAVFRQFRGNHK